MSALTDTFTAIANKIRAKLGVQTTYTPAEMPTGIEAVYAKGVSDTKVGTAAAGDVLSGKTFTNASSVGANGSMTNKGSTGFTITNTSAVTIPAGYYNGSGTIQTSGMMVTPTATKSITANGSNIDVLSYAKANVSVSPYRMENYEYRNTQAPGGSTDTLVIPTSGTYVVLVIKQVSTYKSGYLSLSNDSYATKLINFGFKCNDVDNPKAYVFIMVLNVTNSSGVTINIPETYANSSDNHGIKIYNRIL